MAGWLTIEEARERWRDAEQIDDAQLQEILDAGAQNVTDYGPAAVAENIAATGEVPGNYRLAQLDAAKNEWNQAKHDPQGWIGSDEFPSRPAYINWKPLIRPRRAKPVVA